MKHLCVGVMALTLSASTASEASGQGALERAESDPSCAQIAAATGMAGTIAGVFSAASGALESVWSLGAAVRGRAIEDALGGNDYNGKKIPVDMSKTVTLNGTKISTVNSENFPKVDKWDGRTLTSIKSMDLNTKTYSRPSTVERIAKGYVNDIRSFKGAYSPQGGFHVPARGQKRALIIAVPACPKDAAVRKLQKEALDRVIEYGKDRTQGLFVDVVVKFFLNE